MVTRYTQRKPNTETGMAMVLVIVILAALLGIGAVGLSLQLNSTKSTKLLKDSRSSLYCAEAGLAAGRDLLVANRSAWNSMLDGNPLTNPPWYPIQQSIDDDNGDGVVNNLDTPDYSVEIRDDGDDLDTTTDSNDTILVISTCTQFANAPSQVIEVISMSGQGNSYRNQSGQGAGNTGNAN